MHRTDTGSAALSRAGPAQTLPHLLRRRLGGRRGLMIGGATIIAAGLASGWSWITAIGAAPILISLAPCLAMCALGLCMPRMMRGNSCAPGRSAGDASGQISGAGPGPAPAPPSPEPQRPPLAALPERPPSRGGHGDEAARFPGSARERKGRGSYARRAPSAGLVARIVRQPPINPTI